MKSFLERAFTSARSASPWSSGDLIRAELFSAERLQLHAESLAHAQTVTPRLIVGRPLARRLADNSAALLEAHRAIARTIDAGGAITPAAEWLVDNFHVVEEQIREVRTDLPRGYYRQLPKLADGALAGFPRVFGLAWAFVAHTDSRFESQLLCRFVSAYQSVQPLSIGELWAVPITLRVILVENLRRAAEAIVARRISQQQADAVADRLLGVGGEAPASVADVLRGHEQVPLSTAFIAQLLQRLRDQDPRVTPALLWLEERLTGQGTDADAAVREEHQRQGAMNVTVRNIITSMRLISSVDWAELFESVSLVDATLREGSDFAAMDFATRDSYRAAIEALARGSMLDELDVARRVVAAASKPVDEAPGPGGSLASRAADPGYHLIGGGRARFERAIGYRPPLAGFLHRLNTRVGIGGYIAFIAMIAAAVLGFALAAPWLAGAAGWQLALLALFGLIPATDLATAFVNRDATSRFGATTLPGLALRDGIPLEFRTIVVVPVMLTTLASIEEQVARLEVHHLASLDGDLRFVLLSDWPDAESESIASDAETLDAAAAGIAALNRRHGPAADGERFLLLHRRRIWSDGERKWMGWERKRGKLHELNRLLRGATDTTFIAAGGRPPTVPPGVRYVITLDADTRLPRDAARRLVGKIAHPLNRPRFDPATGRVVEGYGVLQPRVTPSLPIGLEGSLFQRVFSSTSGIDPYAAAVSDVYQDLFGEGSYAGKGIYDVDAFEAALAGRVPENAMLSHDLFEGIFARAGLVSDVEVVEEFPARYDVAISRQHRWARGDWQLLPWIFGRNAAGSPRRVATIPLIGIWKMVDNLRRTLSAPSCVLALVTGWSLPAPASFIWTGFIAVTIAMPALMPVFSDLLPRRAGVSPRSHLQALGATMHLAALQSALLLTFLADQAWSMTDAIARTVFRLCFGGRRMLEWLTAAQAGAGSKMNLAGHAGRMAGGLVVGAIAVLIIAAAGWTPGLWIAAPIVALWLVSPLAARWVSISPAVAGRLAIKAEDRVTLRLIARRTWRYFETYVTTADNMLPPDNFQEDPAPVVARRTSPTNIGLYLLSVIAARDFGWIGICDAVDRFEATFATIGKLERHRGHLFNWYATADLRPLDPRYVSAVDSGNLAGHLIVVASACRQWRGALSSDSPWRDGVADALRLLRDSLRDTAGDPRSDAVTRKQLGERLDAFAGMLRADRPASRDPVVEASECLRQAAVIADVALAFAEESRGDSGAEVLLWAEAMLRTVESRHRDCLPARVAALTPRLMALEAAASAMVAAMEFGFLLDPARKLLSIGYLATEGMLDASCYDLLASEARLASFVAIAKGDVPARHWFRLGRAITPVGGSAALVSWSGSMFEYLMPSLVMRAAKGSLLEQTSRLIVRRQIAYADSLGLPWGISESAYNARDLEFTYQYSNFGVPGLGLKRGLKDNVVIAPYATALATMVAPTAAIANFVRLTAAGALGRFGFYEALDYTPARLPVGAGVAIVRAYMAHHQGMTIVSIANALFDGRMRARFHDEPMVQATELLLQERPPRDVAIVRPRAEEVHAAEMLGDFADPPVRRIDSPHGSPVATHLLSNGRYSVMLTAAGSGYSRWKDLAITRWREDSTRDDWGSYVFLRDVESGAVWSAGFQPTGIEPEFLDIAFSEDRADIVRRDGTMSTTLEVLVSPEDDAEVRRVTLVNSSTRTREIELTSYAEIVLAPPAGDAAHAAFSKLFVQTEFLASIGVILATRRRRDPGEGEVWAAHLAVVQGTAIGDIEVETDRARFIGRGHGLRDPRALAGAAPLGNTVGTVLDPIFALRRRVRLAPGATARIAFWTVVAGSRSGVLDAADRLQDATAFDRASTLAWTQAQVQLRHLGMKREEAALFQRLAGHVLYADAGLRPSSDRLRQGVGGQPALWSAGISGDLPIVLVRIEEMEELDLAHQLLRAREYWRLKQLAVDLVILNERASSYIQDLQIALETMVRTTQARRAEGAAASGSVFVLRADLLSAEARAMLLSAARVVLVGRRGSLSDQLARLRVVPPIAAPTLRAIPRTEPVAVADPTATLEFFNGLGGFAADGREYVTVLGPGQRTPAPWINVIANPRFGFHVGAEGGGYTWSANSRENQLTPWSNDPVCDRSGEAFYLRDRDSGALWSPTASPIRDEAATYVARHGQGYSRFEHTAHGIALELLQYVALDAPIKISRLTIRNLSGRARRLSVTGYVEWVLGANRAGMAPHIVTEIDGETGALLARNPWSTAFGPVVAFVDMAGRHESATGDRRAFIGRNGGLDHPAALLRDARLPGECGAGLDPCGALQARLDLPANGRSEIVFLLGQGSGIDEARALIRRFRAADLDAVLGEVEAHWGSVLGAVQVRTPDRAMDIMLNGWLLYQTLACRIWARAGFYQASGAFGFRDQLQDGMALAIARPDLTREHLLRAASRQFAEGDVQHWWLPHSGQGVRTRISDDSIWLAYAVRHYVALTGDRAVLDAMVPFLEGPALRPSEHDAFFQPMIAETCESLFEHCARGLDRSLALGAHGLPLIGTGDWNDGMNRVGAAGRGESVWLGWFLHATLIGFAPHAAARGDAVRAARWRSHAADLAVALEREAWDGAWYRRGYFDDGTPLGAATSVQCRIDSIAQSWAVISGAAPRERAAAAMAAADRMLVSEADRLMLLFTPPFDAPDPDPGYVGAYPPGIRENGGQYTHAAIWSVIAFAMLGNGDRAAELFSLINPIARSATRSGMRRYKVEPYVLAADVYAQRPHVGRGGWTWYTGSAGWLYRAGLESILGFQLSGDHLLLDPCIPTRWPGCEIVYRRGATRYEITLENPNAVGGGILTLDLDGVRLPDRPARVKLVDDGRTHHIRVGLG